MNIRPEGTYLDLTFGGGGHSREILRYLKKGRLFAFDVDREAERNVPDDRRFFFIRGNFRFVRNFLRYHKVDSIDGALADLGISSHHLDEATRGFSYRSNNQLDMRMNQEAERSAQYILNHYDKDQLKAMFSRYGEIRNAGKLSEEIVQLRNRSHIKSSDDLLEGIGECIPSSKRNKYLSQVFQAIRIEVNDELEALKEMLEGVTDLLLPGGRFCVITYHSLEDRLVKHFFRAGNFQGTAEADLYGRRKVPYRAVSKGVITPGPEEINNNSRARSAKLRVAERMAVGV